MTSLKSISYRNAKYQGQMNGQTFHREGLGILIDQNFLFVVGIWVRNLLNGPTFISFPNKTKFFGHMKDNHPNGLCCIALPDSIKIYINYTLEKTKPQMAIVFENSGIILSGKLTKNERGQNIQFISKKQFSNEQQRKTIIQSITKCNIDDSIRNWRTFIQREIYTPKKHILEFVDLRKNKLVYIGFKRSETLGACFESNGNVNSLGYYEKQYNLLEIGRKYINKLHKEEIQQGIYSTPKQIFVYQAKYPRPPEAQRAILNYFKQSIAFKNEFINLDSFKDLYIIAKNINKTSLDAMLEEQAQIQLQQSRVKVKQSNLNELVTQYSLQNIRKGIQAAVQRKRNASRSLNRSYDSPQKRSKVKFIDSPRRSIKNSRLNETVSYYRQQQPFKFLQTKQKKLMKTNESSNNNDTMISRHVNSPKSPTKMAPIPPKPSKSPHKKFKYLDTDLAKLTQIYEQIKYELKPATPTKKLQKKNTNSRYDLVTNKADDRVPERDRSRSTSKNTKVYKYC